MPAATDLTIIEPAPQQGKMMLLDYMADKYSLNPDEFSRTVRAVCGMPTATPEQFAAFLLVAKTYDLNPLIKEIYAFPGKGGGIVPIVSIDGWVNLVNSHPACDGFEFDMEHSDDGKLIACTCRMYRKDRSRPVNVTEYLSECKRPTDPWKMEHRMLRHKAMIQAARYAFGFAGIYDPDEGEKIASGGSLASDSGPPRQIAKPAEPAAEQAEPPAIEAEDVRDGDPPPREAKPKDGPISSGPPRTPTTGSVKATDTKPAAKAAETGPNPHRIPGANHTFESWAEKFSDLVKTSEDTATVYKWIDENTKDFTTPDVPQPQIGPLKRLEQKKPSVYATVRKTIEVTMQTLRDAQAKAAEKAAKKPAPAKAAASDMDDSPDQPAQSDPESILKQIDAELAAVDDADNLQDVWDRVCDPLVNKLDFPPDKDEAQAIYNKHEKRLGGD